MVLLIELDQTKQVSGRYYRSRDFLFFHIFESDQYLTFMCDRNKLSVIARAEAEKPYNGKLDNL